MSDVRGDAPFAALGESVKVALADRGFDAPTAPQRAAVPPIAAGDHTLVAAPTGTGKTEAAMLPVFDAIVSAQTDERPFGISALYVTPLRALNRDMRERLEWWGDRLQVDVDVRHGDTTDYRRRQQATDPPDVLVTTPETLQAMLTGERLRTALTDVNHVVVDEVHELAADKRGTQLAVALERLQELSGEFQRIGLSATIGDPDEIGAFLTGDRTFEVVTVGVGSNLSVSVRAPTIRQSDEELAGELMTDAEIASHVRAIREEVRTHDSTLIFVNTRQTAEALGSRFNSLDMNIGVHHGSLSRATRVDVEQRFKEGSLDALLCTSSMELGIDLGRVDHVVQYRSPRQVTRLLQRVGRAGHRRDETSSGTIIASSPDELLEGMVVARRAAEGAVEAADIHHGSLDVVANQIGGMVQGYGQLSARRAYEIVTRAYPFTDLSEAVFRAVVDELSGNRVIWVDKDADSLETTGTTWQYVYDNLSMIPDEATFTVEDVASGRQVGTLDERFVIDFAERDAVFIQGGAMWRVANVDDAEGTVEVSPVEDPGGEIPSWTGEEIPVPAAVATEVGELRRTASEQLATGDSLDSVARRQSSRYPADSATIEVALERLADHVTAGQPVPTDRRIVIESERDHIVVNCALGSAGNETIGRVVAALLGQRTGSSIGLTPDPYRVGLDVPAGLSGTEVAELLDDIDPEHVRPILELSLRRSDRLTWVLSTVAAKFGRVNEESGLSGKRLQAALEETPVHEEALRQLFHEDLDVDLATETLTHIQSDELPVAVVGERTPIGLGGRSAGRELLSPENADASVIDAVRERIQNEEVILACVHCGEWTARTRVRRVDDQPVCPECGATRIAALSPYAEESLAAIEAGSATSNDDHLERAHRNANLVQAHGKQAVIALRARGVGPTNAARVIGKLREHEEDFYRDILEREREYARTRSFWD